jgi:hypothetical protein
MIGDFSMAWLSSLCVCVVDVRRSSIQSAAERNPQDARYSFQLKSNTLAFLSPPTRHLDASDWLAMLFIDAKRLLGDIIIIVIRLFAL